MFFFQLVLSSMMQTIGHYSKVMLPEKTGMLPKCGLAWSAIHFLVREANKHFNPKRARFHYSTFF